MTIGIVVSEFNYDITMMMLERAKAHAEFLGANITDVVKVPGVFDMPLAVKRLAKREDIHGVVTLGELFGPPLHGIGNRHRCIPSGWLVRCQWAVGSGQ